MLKHALIANAIFSLTTASLIFPFQEWLMHQFSGPAWFWNTLGAGLYIFAIQLILMARIPNLAKKLTPLIIYSDIAWIVLTFIGWIVFHSSISFVGGALILVINIIVGVLAILQVKAYHAYLN